MKEIYTTLRIPTPEQYSYVEIAIEGDLTPKDVANLYWDYTMAFKPKPEPSGLDDKTLNATLDEYLQTSSVKNGTELWEKMNPAQQAIFQAIKKSLKRIAAKQAKV